jgi:hypothetical protein
MLALACDSGALIAQQKPLTLEQLEQLQTFDEARNSLDRLRAMVEIGTREKRTQCIRAFGAPGFCECLTTNLPVGASFQGYVQIVTTTKTDLQYQSLSVEDRKMVDAVTKARETCVAKHSGK